MPETWKGKTIQMINRAVRPSGLALVRAETVVRAQGSMPIQCGPFAFTVEPHHPPFWTAYGQQRWEPETLQILREVLTQNSVYWDIGAWIGPTVLYAAKLAGTVIACEPDPFAFTCLLQNLTLNRMTHVRAFNLALSTSDGIGEMRSFGTELGDSMSSLLPGAKSDGWPVTTVTIDTLVNRLHCPPPNVLKIDIEGGEFDLIPAIRPWLARWRPILCLSTHAPFLPAEARQAKLAALVEALADYPGAEAFLGEPYAADFGTRLLRPSSQVFEPS